MNGEAGSLAGLFMALVALVTALGAIYKTRRDSQVATISAENAAGIESASLQLDAWKTIVDRQAQDLLDERERNAQLEAEIDKVNADRQRLRVELDSAQTEILALRRAAADARNP